MVEVFCIKTGGDGNIYSWAQMEISNEMSIYAFLRGYQIGEHYTELFKKLMLLCEETTEWQMKNQC